MLDSSIPEAPPSAFGVEPSNTGRGLLPAVPQTEALASLCCPLGRATLMDHLPSLPFSSGPTNHPWLSSLCCSPQLSPIPSLDPQPSTQPTPKNPVGPGDLLSACTSRSLLKVCFESNSKALAKCILLCFRKGNVWKLTLKVT